ncbi:unnamed protein product [Symbiodinium natans]|uniref:Uncharacterized protein n=1 Tax=Symbiodinium natans TaxID=878477 RepID=A0A812I3S3_9DINO|nr:unnamed protein product [Symbiodinium natans]
MDPPYCAERTACVIMDLVDAAQQIVAMTGDCMGDLEDPPNCANDIFGLLYDLVDASACTAAMASACGGIVTGCEQSAFYGCEDLFSVAQDLIGATGNCDVDAFLCIINLVDAINDAITMSLDVKGAVDSCPAEREGLFHKWLRQEHPEWFPWRLLKGGKRPAYKELEKEKGAEDLPRGFGRLYRSTINSQYLTTFETRDSRIGLLDVTHSGPIIAMDSPGALRVGSAFVLPYSSSKLYPQAVRGDRDARRLNPMEDGTDGVMEFAFDEPSQLVTLHDVADVEVFFLGDVVMPEDAGPEGIQAFE